MSTQAQFRRGTTAQLAAVTPALGEIGSDSTKKKIVVGDGATPGGILMARDDELSNLASQIADRRLHVFNGNFDVWQRGTSQTISGYGSDDAWLNEHNGSSKVHSQQKYAAGQTVVPGNPRYFSRTVVTSVAGAANYARKTFRIGDVRKFQGQNVTLTLYGAEASSKSIAVELVQNFGTGGSPSATVTQIGTQKIALGTTLAKKQVIIAVPSISGMTIGSNEDSYLELVIWFDAGSNFNLRTNSLGQQSGTFDIGRVSIVPGDATNIADPFCAVDLTDVEARCMARFTRLTGLFFNANRTAGATVFGSWTLPVKMLKSPTPVIQGTPSYANASGVAVSSANQLVVSASIILTAAGYGHVQFDLDLSADL